MPVDRFLNVRFVPLTRQLERKLPFFRLVVKLKTVRYVNRGEGESWPRKTARIKQYMQIWREIECRDNTVSDSEKDLLKF